jgi:hypothetical protein
MKHEATTQELDCIDHYQKNLIRLLNMPEDKHMKIMVKDGACPKLIKSRIQSIRSLLTAEVRTIEKWRKNKPLN